MAIKKMCKEDIYMKQELVLCSISTVKILVNDMGICA